MLNIGAYDQHLTVALNPKTIRATRVIVPLTGDGGFHIVDVSKAFAGIFDLQKFKLGPHSIQLHRKILRLHRHLEDLPQIADGLAPTECENRNFLLGIIRRHEKWETLQVIPMEMSERDDQLVLVMSDRAHVPAEISKSSSGVNNRDAICIRKRNLKARSVAAELLKPSIADWDRSSRAVKLKPHRILFHKGNSSPREREGNKSRQPVAHTSRCCGPQALSASLIVARVQPSLDASSAHLDLDQIAILQAEMISQIDVSDDLDDPGVPSIPRRSRRCPQERLSMIETH